MPTFEQPFEMLEACHERVHRMLDLLARLRAHLAQHGADEQARQAARDVMRYFDQAAPQHHRDEELHVFPPLLAQGEPATVKVVQQLQRDHERMETGWAAARSLLDGIAEGRLTGLDASQAQCLDDFASLYGAHIEAEEGIAYPATRALLDADAQQAMGREMAMRRGVTP
jgi:hemerythrin-like domain-containing protein